MVKLRIGDRFAVIALVILLVGVAAPTRAQEAEPSPGDLPDVPIRTLVDIPVPAEPYLPSAPEEPEVIAEHWFAASDDEERRDIALDVLAGIGLGVYTMDGTPILFGAEQSIDDPWLYDFEVALLAADAATAAETTVADIAASLDPLLTDASGSPFEASALAELIRSATAEAQADPGDPVGFPLRLARELELAASGRDLALEVPVDEPLTSFAAALIELDILMPFTAGDGAAIASVAEVYMPVAAQLSPRSPGELGLASAQKPRTAQICGRIASWAGKKSWDIGKLGARMIRGGALWTGLTPPAQLAHLLFLRLAVRVRGGTLNPEPHYLHPDSDSFNTASFYVQVLVDIELSPEAMACGALSGLRLPKAGPLPGIDVDWHTGPLEDHGRLICPPDECLKTDGDGYALLVFAPKEEPAPAGLGPEEYDRALVISRVNYLLDLGNLYGRIPLSGTWTFRDVRVSWHQPYRLELEIDSKLVIDGYLNATAKASGRIPIRDQGDGLVAGEGSLATQTDRRRADGCKQEAYAEGSGSIDWLVPSVVIVPDERDVLVYVNAGSAVEHPDRLTRPPCPPLPRAITKDTVWEHYFFQSHQKDMSQGEGFFLDGWTWKADDETFRSGGLLATLDTPERCKGPLASCTGMTHFKLYIYPIED